MDQLPQTESRCKNVDFQLRAVPANGRKCVRNELWENNFDLDDWDVGFVSDVPLTETWVHDDDDYDDNDEYEEPVDDAWWLVHQMEGYCVGYEHIEYRGRHYYMVHHA